MQYKRVLVLALAICAGLALTITSWAAEAKSNQSGWGQPTFCDQFPFLCTEQSNIQGQKYSGHDEPALLFYSSTPGSGNSFKGLITLPKDPKTKPVQDGSGGTWNFELHPAFWFGMAMCDTQSYPEFTNTCTPDSDSNIFDDASGPGYIGNHPGTAFMEMQFYPPGWVIAPDSTPCSATKWCAALNIDSLLQSAATGAFNNSACEGIAGDETVNFAYITKSGNSVVPASPLTGFANQVVVSKDVFLMNPGDTIEVRMFDTSAGFEVILTDLKTGKSGSMTPSTANGFAQIDFEPSSSVCHATAYAFHPMYSTSGVHTRVPWAAHSYNVAYSDEIGHFELCGDTACNTGDDGASFIDDIGCFASTFSSKIKVGACTFNDTDYNGSSYLLDWPGTDSDAATDAKMHAKPIVFNGSFIGTADGAAHQYDSVAFETDLPAIQSCFSSSCPNPPTGASFYPFFSSASGANSGCVWQEGGATLPNSNYTFDGNTFADSTEYGTSAISLVYAFGGGSVTAFEDFQNPLSSNPCQAALPNLTANVSSITFKTTKVGKTGAAKKVKISNSLTNKTGMGLMVSAQLDDTADFTITKTTCSGELLPKQHCTVTVTPGPVSSGTINGNLTISADAGNSPITIPLSVTGD